MVLCLNSRQSGPRRASAILAMILVGTLVVTSVMPAVGSLADPSPVPPPSITEVGSRESAQSDLKPQTSLAQDRQTAAPLVDAPPETVGLRGSTLDRIDRVVENGCGEDLYPGVVVLVSRDGRVVKDKASGYAVLYDEHKERLSEPIEASGDTIYDLASVTKLFTATAVMKLAEEQRVDLDAPVADYIPEFAANGKQSVTLRQLLTHTSGLPEGINLNGVKGDLDAREQAVYKTRLVSRPGQQYRYSDVNFIVLGKVVERVSGQSLDVFLADNFFEPLGMHDTMYNPPEELRPRIAATEVNPGPNRGLVWGEVHDGTAYALGGVAGNAGLFSTARDMAVFGQMIANGGQYGGVRVLEPDTVAEMLEPQFTEPGGRAVGLGWEIGQAWYMGEMAEHEAVGHTGYTGTSLVVCPKTKTVVVLLTNRVHPTASGNTNAVRRDTATLVARALIPDAQARASSQAPIEGS